MASYRRNVYSGGPNGGKVNREKEADDMQVAPFNGMYVINIHRNGKYILFMLKT